MRRDIVIAVAWIVCLVSVDHDADVVANMTAKGVDTIDVFVEGETADLHLHSGKTRFGVCLRLIEQVGPSGIVDVVLCVEEAGGVGADLVSDFAAEQLVNRQTACLAHQIVQRHVNRAGDIGRDPGVTASLIPRVDDRLPDAPKVLGVHADYTLSNVCESGGIDTGLAPSVRSIIGDYTNR